MLNTNKSKARTLLLTLALLLPAPYSIAQTGGTISGVWKTFDDDTNQPAALVEISEKIHNMLLNDAPETKTGKKFV